MDEDVFETGADGLTDADFVGALGDRNQHDVHNADAADDERNGGDESKNAGNNHKEGIGGVGDGVAVGDSEVFVAGFTGF